MATSNFSVSGLSTGMDTASIIDKLVSLEQQPITNLQTSETAFKSQISILGNVASKLQDLQTAAQGLASGGALGLGTTSSNSTFTATPGSGAVAGSYDVQVLGLASAAKWRSGPFASEGSLQDGTLQLAMGTQTFSVKVAQGASLSTVAAAIQASGAPVSAVVLNDGTSSYLSLTALQTGFTGATPASALQVSFGATAAGEAGLDPTATATSQAAANASFTIDGLTFTRTSNTVTDALPGTTLKLTATGPKETLTVEADASATKAKLQTFVDAYNGAMALVQQQLDESATTDRTTTLAGDFTMRSLQQALQGLVSAVVPGTGAVRSLADLGIATQRDGSLTIDSGTLANAIAADPAAVNAVFSTASTGMGALASSLVSTYTAPTTGLLSLRQQGLQDQVSQTDDRIAQMQARVDAYRQTLTNQYAAMESIVGQFKTIGDFLTQQSNALAASKS